MKKEEKKTLSTKTKIYVAIAYLIIFSAFGFLTYAAISSAMHQSALDKTLIKLDFNELQEKIKNKDTFILVISQKKCSHCAEFKPVFKEVLLENNVIAYEIDQSSLNKKEYGKLKDIASISGTPTTVFIVDGEEISTSTRLKGSGHSKKALKARLKAMGYIKEDNNK